MRRRKKAYRAIIIDLRKIFKIIIFIFLIIALATALFLGFSAFKGASDTNLKKENPIVKTFRSALSLFTGFYPNNLFGIIKSEFPEIGVFEATPLWSLAMENQANDAIPVYNPENADTTHTSPSPDKTDGARYSIKSIDTSQAKNLSGTGKKILIKNETNYSIDVSQMLSSPLPFTLGKKEPEILILHTHATESYTPEGDDYYDNTKSDRTQDVTRNVVKIGECMAEIFRENGIETLHDTTLHDYPNYNGSYANSLKTGEEYLKDYPSIKMIIDVHRDAIVYSDGTKAKVITEINGKKAAQLMFVIGTDAGGLEHPDWRKNLQLSIKLQNTIEEKFPGLMRGINLRKERFNEHLTTGSMILEVGTSGNTLDEAIYGAQCAAKAIAEALKK